MAGHDGTYSFNGGANVATSTLADGTVKASVKGHQKLSVRSLPDRQTRVESVTRANRDAEVTAWRACVPPWTLTSHSNRKIVLPGVPPWKVDGERLISVLPAQTKPTRWRTLKRNSIREKQQWGADAPGRQDAIDPFRGAVLTCP